MEQRFLVCQYMLRNTTSESKREDQVQMVRWIGGGNYQFVANGFPWLRHTGLPCLTNYRTDFPGSLSTSINMNKTKAIGFQNVTIQATFPDFEWFKFVKLNFMDFGLHLFFTKQGEWYLFCLMRLCIILIMIHNK